ncbi:HNH endonuclease signature motif containing protein [Agromyces aerolatus]|uniref:HNH endonuclease signature motif containing protein n=1 Tax=Agromyces sp. LY-1074 TaxID=3074080 RepID=UPI002859E778|nr:MULTISPECIES: DUF222 domain-containing protein [unclassified Agromyces]MDR5699457.1 DUF222 domain-containing protein [Agromyces sp. LY-1074]MDR5705753.1 DUF222 domain-containing protein [Agromyces sp. LY-1358]
MQNSIPPPADIPPPPDDAASTGENSPAGIRAHGGLAVSEDARDELAALVAASAGLRRAMSRLEAKRLMSVHAAIQFAVDRADAFVAPHVGRAARRDLARRAVVAELAVAWRVSEYSMQRLVSDAYVLCTVLPATLAAMREGELDGAHARVIADAVRGLDADSGVIAAADVELAGLGREMTPAELRHAAKRVLERLQADTLAQRHARAFAERAVQLESARDGMAWLAIQMRAADALLIRDRLQQAVRVARADGTETRTSAQLEADLARDLLLHATPAPRDVLGVTARAGATGSVPRRPGVVGSVPDGPGVVGSVPGGPGVVGSVPDGPGVVGSVPGGPGVVGSAPTRPGVVGSAPTRPGVVGSVPGGLGEAGSAARPGAAGHDVDRSCVPGGERVVSVGSAIRPTVHVTVPVLTLLGLDEAPADLDGYGPIDAETARELAAQAPSFTRLLTHPITGTVLDVDRGSYRVPADLRKWLQVRDGACRFPGCTRRAARCEADHSQDWAHEGTTAHDNLAHLCAPHHHLKHETAWSVKHLEGGTLEWTSLTGQVYRTTPEGDLRFGPDHRDAEMDDDGDRAAERGPERAADPSCDAGAHPGSPGRSRGRRRPPATYATNPMF